MRVEIISRVLPGIGICQEIALHDGRRIGVVTRRDGTRDLVLYDEEGDGAAGTVALNDDEADAVAELLGVPQLVTRLAELQNRAGDLVTEQLLVPTGAILGHHRFAGGRGGRGTEVGSADGVLRAADYRAGRGGADAAGSAGRGPEIGTDPK